MNNKKNIKIILITSASFIVIMLLLLGRFNIINLRGQVALGNSSFNDPNLYSSVVNAYYADLVSKDENALLFEREKSNFYDSYEDAYDVLSSPDVSYNALQKNSTVYKFPLSDEDLNVIIELESAGVSDTSGIEKLINLEKLSLTGDFDSVDLSNNIKLEEIFLKSSSLKSIKLSNNYMFANATIIGDKFVSIGGEGILLYDNDLILKDFLKYDFNGLSMKLYKPENDISLLTDDGDLVNINNLNLIDVTDLYKNYTAEQLNNTVLEISDNKEFTYKLPMIYMPESYEMFMGVDSLYESVLYPAVISQYNADNNTEYTAAKMLSSKELNKVKKLHVDCAASNIELSKYELYVLNSLENLEDLSLTNCGLNDIVDYSSYKLKKLDLSGNNFQEFTLNMFPSLEELKIKNNNDLAFLVVSGVNLEKLDVGGNVNLSMLYVFAPMLNEIKNVSALTNLSAIIINYAKLDKLNLANNQNLAMINFAFSDLSKTRINLIVGETKKIELDVKLPDNLNPTELYNEDDYIASVSNGFVTGNNYGLTVISQFYSTFDTAVGTSIMAPLKTYVYVYKISSSKFTINNEHKYIFVGSESDDKVIKRYIKVKGENVSKLLSKNGILSIYDKESKEEVFKYKIINITSDKYDIGDNKITYTGTFDINKLSVLNADLVVTSNNTLQVINDDIIIKEYSLEKGGE